MNGHGAVLLGSPVLLDTAHTPIYAGDAGAPQRKLQPTKPLAWTAEDDKSGVLVAGVGWRTV